MQNQQQLNNTKWVKDKEAKKCRDCESSFNTLFRRKHHCRNCGEVFCDSCSKYYLDRKYFKENERIKKDKVRLCKACYLKIIDNLRQNGEQIQQFKLEDPYNQMRRHSKSFNVNDKLPESATQVSTHISSLLDTKSNSIRSDTSTQSPIVIQEDELTKKQKKLEQNMNEIISQIITQAVQKCGIGDNWLATISQFLKQMMQDLKDLNVCPERILGQETIEKLIKIKVIPFINYQATRYIKGVMIRKNIAHKKMQTSFKNAKILLLWDSLDPNIQNFEALVKNEKKIIQQALEYIEKLGPNIILIEKSINNLILNQLQEKNITVSICCRQKQLQKIAEATSAKIQKALDIFRQNCDPDCLGTSERVVYINCDGESIRSNSQVYNSLSDINKSSLQCYLETKNLDSTILFICDPHSSRISLSVSGPKIDELKNIKQCFIQYIPLAYEVLLEYQMINLDLKLKRDLALLYKQQDTGVQMLTSGEIFDFSSFQQQNEGVQIQKITYHIGVKSKIYDVNKKKNSECLEQYIQNNLQNFNGKAIQKFCQMCDKQEEKKCFLESIKYQKNDITIGKYLAEKAIYDNQKCGKCNTKKIDHISIRYGPGGFFKCVVEKKKLELTLQNASENQPSKSVSDFNYIEGQDDGVQQEIQQIEQTSKQKVYQFNISTYLGCKSCNKLLTKQYQLGQQLEYSFFRLVQHSITNSIRQRKKLNMNWLEFHGQLENQEKEMQCSHPEIERIFECGDNLIKLSTNVFDIYSVKTFHFYTQEVEFHLKNFDRDEVSKRYDEISIILQKIQQFISVFLEQSNLRNSKFSMSSSVSIQTSSSILQNQNQLPKILEEIAKIQERMKIYLYEDFISFECDCMQLFYNCNRMQNIIFPTSKPKQSDISMIKSTQIRQQTMMLEKEPQVKSYIFQRKTLKENSLIPQSQPIQINEYPIQQLSPQQFPYSPDSPVQDIEESTEISVGRISNENDQNGTFLKNIIKNWPRQALNWDQFSVNWSRQAQNFESTQPNNQFYNYLPIYSQGEVDLIASSLNDSRYYYLYQQWQIENLWNKFQEFTVQKQSENCFDFQTEVTQILKEQPKLTKEIKEITLRVQKNPQLVQKQSSNNLQEDDQSVYDEESQSTIGLTVPAESPRKPQRQVQIQIFYPKQFECFRIMNGIHIKQFIKSILSCTNWNSAGGKSGSSFYKSADNLFIFKAVKPQEFETFEIFAPKYFIHMYNIFFNDKKSVLNKIYGMFTIKNSKGIQYFIAMENLFYGMAPDLLVYDLKGSGANRWNRKNQKTLLDTNYIIDRNGEPLPINEKDYEIVEKAFEFDSEFLLEVKVVDYSLLLIIDKMNHQIKLAIIDYLQDFDIKKRVENKFKTAINLGNEQPTIVSPKEYQERFIKAMQRYFMKIYSSL